MRINKHAHVYSSLTKPLRGIDVARRSVSRVQAIHLGKRVFGPNEFLPVLHCGNMDVLQAANPISQGARHDKPSPTHDRRHAGAESRPEYPVKLRSTGLPVCTILQRSPEQLGPEEIRAYQVYLTNERKLAPSSVLIAVAALRFLYKVTLKREWIFEDVIPAPKKPQKLP